MRSGIVTAVVALSLTLAGACRRPVGPNVLASGVVSACENRWEEAVQFWRRALLLGPDSAAVRNNLAVAYEKMGAWEEARKEYEAALRLEPDNAAVKENFDRFKARLGASREKGR